jgi:hypothetical protein
VYFPIVAFLLLTSPAHPSRLTQLSARAPEPKAVYYDYAYGSLSFAPPELQAELQKGG